MQWFRIKRSVCCLAVVLVICSGTLAAQGLTFPRVAGDFRPSVEPFENGYIDWGNGFYYTVSKGFPPAEKKSRLKNKPAMSEALKIEKAKTAAIEGAKAQILMMANNIRVDADATLGDLIAAGFRVKVEGDIKNYEIVKEGWIQIAGCYEVVVRAPITSVSSQLIDSQITKLKTGVRAPVEEAPVPQVEEPVEVPPAPPVEEVPAEEPKEKTKEEKIEDIKDKAEAAEEEMLLLIDAQGTGANAAVFPEVKDEDGADLFNITLPPKLKVKHEQMVKYVETDKKGDDLLNLLENHPNILYVRALPPTEKIVFVEEPFWMTAADEGAKPDRRKRFSVKASSSDGKLKANIVVTKEDAKKILEADAKAGFFENANVYILMDPSIGGTEGRRIIPLEALIAGLEL